jgi:rhodanese-related sulfurtransferase
MGQYSRGLDFIKEGAMAGSLVLEHGVGRGEAALAHFRAKLSWETDVSDVHADLQSGAPGFVVIDGRSTEAYERGHIPGAISLPHRTIDAHTAAAAIPADRVAVTYCDGFGCNASTKAALKLLALGYAVKEMPGGLDWWQREGYDVHVKTPGKQAPGACTQETEGARCGC